MKPNNSLVYKIILLILVMTMIAWNVNCFGQDTTKAQLEMIGRSYFYKGTRLNERKLQDLVYTSNDPEIISLVDGAKRQHKLQYLGLATIPTAAAAFFCFTVATLADINGDKKASDNYIAGGVGCAVISSSFLIGSETCKAKRRHKMKAAAKIYMQKY